MSVRSWLVDQLNLTSEGWDVIAEQRIPDAFARTTVILKHAHIEPRPDGTPGQLRHEVVMSVFSTAKKVATAEDKLDDAVTRLLTKLDAHERISWTGAEKVVTPNEQFFGWDIHLSVLTDPEA